MFMKTKAAVSSLENYQMVVMTKRSFGVMRMVITIRTPQTLDE